MHIHVTLKLDCDENLQRPVVSAKARGVLRQVTSIGHHCYCCGLDLHHTVDCVLLPAGIFLGKKRVYHFTPNHIGIHRNTTAARGAVSLA